MLEFAPMVNANSSFTNISSAGISLPEGFAKLLFVTQAHLGGVQVSQHMKNYIYGERNDRIKIFSIEKMWEKFVLAARAIAGMPESEGIIAISCKTFAPKAVLRFSELINCKPYTGRFIPGSFTNKNIKNSCEPSLIIVSDPVFDKQALHESAAVNCPTIAFCNTDADLPFVDIAIPVNNRSPKAIGASFFILSRLVNYIRHGASLDDGIKDVELFFYRDAKELEKLWEEQNAENAVEFADAPIQDDIEGDFGRSTVEVGGCTNPWDNDE